MKYGTTINERPTKCTYKKKKFCFGFEDCFLQNCHIIAFHSTCWKELDAGMQPTAQIKHFSIASRPLAYYEQQSQIASRNFGNQTVPPHPHLLSVRLFPYTP